MSRQGRWEYLKAIHPRYGQASRAEKQRILDEFCHVTRYHRKSTLRLLNGPPPGQQPPRRRRPPACQYSTRVIQVLAAIWAAAGYPWSVRLKALLPLWLPWARTRFRLTPALEALLLALSFGIIGATLMEATAKESRLRFEDQINDMVYARAQKALAAKGYQVRRLDTVARKWDLLANIRQGPGAYARVAQGYTLGREADWPDAILFLELLLEGRLEGRIFSSGKLEDLKVESMRLQYAKSKLFLYNPRTQQRLFFDMVQRSYPSFSSTTLPEALDTLVALEDVPAAR